MACVFSHSLSHSLLHSLSHSLLRSLSRSLSLSLELSLAFPFSHVLSLAFSLSCSLSREDHSYLVGAYLYGSLYCNTPVPAPVAPVPVPVPTSEVCHPDKETARKHRTRFADRLDGATPDAEGTVASPSSPVRPWRALA